MRDQPEQSPDEIAALKALLNAREQEIAHLKLLVAKLRRQQFGRRSESLEGLAQLELGLSDMARVPDKAATLRIDTPRTERERPVRKPLPPHLPREIEIHQPAC